MPIIDFSGTYRAPTRAMTLKAMAARQNELAQQTVQATAPEVVKDPLQGAAHVMGVIGAGLREGRAASAEIAGRQRFAELMAGGLTPDEMGEALTLDPETAMTYQQHTWDTEKAAAEQAAKERDALRSHGWDVDAAAAKVEADRKAAEALAASQEASQGRGFTHDDKSAEAKVAADKAAAEALAKNQAAAAAAKAAEPQDEAAKAVDAFNRDQFGDHNTPAAQAILQARLAKINAVGGKGMTFRTNPDGTVSFSMTEGGTGPDYSKIKNPIEGYQTDAQAGNDLLTRTSVIKQALAAAGKTGPIVGPVLGTADDIVRSLSNNNWNLSILGAGEPAARAMLSAENVKQVLDQAAKLKPMSNYDSQMLSQIAIGLDNNPEANWAKLSFANALAQRAVDKAAAAKQWQDDPKNNGDMGGFETYWNQQMAAHPLLQTDQAGNVTYEGHIVVPAALAGGGQQNAPAATPPAGGGGGGGGQPYAPSGQEPAPQSEQDFNNIPPNTVFKDTDGKYYRKMPDGSTPPV